MSQTYTDNCFTTTGVVQTQMGQVEENFAALKSAFSGATTPANTVAGMWWFDTTANILKLRNEANSAWLSVWDFANNKPILANNIIGDFAAALKDPAAGTAGFRTIGTTAVKACAGNDARLSDTRTPIDASVTTAKIADNNVTLEKMETGTVPIAGYGSTQTGSTDYYAQKSPNTAVYIPTSATIITLSCELRAEHTGYTVHAKFTVGDSDSTIMSSSSNSFAVKTATFDASALSGSYAILVLLQGNCRPSDAYIKNVSIYWN